MVWEKVKESLRETLAENIYNLWIEPIKFVQLRGERLSLSRPRTDISAPISSRIFSA